MWYLLIRTLYFLSQYLLPVYVLCVDNPFSTLTTDVENGVSSYRIRRRVASVKSDIMSSEVKGRMSCSSNVLISSFEYYWQALTVESMLLYCYVKRPLPQTFMVLRFCRIFFELKSRPRSLHYVQSTELLQTYCLLVEMYFCFYF